MADRISTKRNFNLKTLRPRKHKELDFFIADEMEIASFRDEMASMEHPFFALKGGDTKVREYVNIARRWRERDVCNIMAFPAISIVL